MATQVVGRMAAILTLDSAGFTKGLKASQGAVGKFSASISGLGALASKGLALAGIGIGAKSLIDLSDAATTVSNKIKTTTSSTKEWVDVQNQLYRVANQTRAPIEATAGQFQRLTIATRGMGVESRRVIDVVGGLNAAVVLSGSSAQEANAGLIQLAQGLASNRLQGDELKSVLENVPLLAQRLAEAFGVTTGALRELGKQGRLNAEVLFPALEYAVVGLQAELSKMPLTFSQAFTILNNSLIESMRYLQETTGITETLAQAIVDLGITISDTARDIGEWASTHERELDRVQGYWNLYGDAFDWFVTMNTEHSRTVIENLTSMMNAVTEMVNRSIPALQRLDDFFFGSADRFGKWLNDRADMSADIEDVTNALLQAQKEAPFRLTPPRPPPPGLGAPTKTQAELERIQKTLDKAREKMRDLVLDLQTEARQINMTEGEKKIDDFRLAMEKLQETAKETGTVFDTLSQQGEHAIETALQRTGMKELREVLRDLVIEANAVNLTPMEQEILDVNIAINETVKNTFLAGTAFEEMVRRAITAGVKLKYANQAIKDFKDQIKGWQQDLADIDLSPAQQKMAQFRRDIAEKKLIHPERVAEFDDALNQGLDALRKLREEELKTTFDLGEAIAASVQGTLRGVLLEGKTAKDVVRDFAGDALDAIESYFLGALKNKEIFKSKWTTNWLTDFPDIVDQGAGLMSKAFGDFFEFAERGLRSLINWLVRTITLQNTLNTLQAIGRGLSWLGGGVVGLVASLFQHGGVVRRPTFGIVGEAGPEAVIPLDRLAGLNTEPKVEVNIHPPSGTTTETRRRRTSSGEPALDIYIKQVVTQDIARGGPIAQTLDNSRGLRQIGSLR